MVVDRHFSQAAQRVERLVLSDGTAFTGLGGIIVGTPGGDVLNGGAGDDLLIGGTDNDLLLGRQGADRYVFATGDGVDRISEAGDSDPTILDTVVVQDIDAFADIGFSRSGPSLILDLGGGDSVVLDRHFSQAVQRVERLELSDGTTLVLADSLIGGPADGIIVGTPGNDFLDAGAGDDVLVGGAGNDLLIGRQGAETYIFSAGDGVDRISEGGGSDPTVLDTVVVQDIASVADIGFARSADGSSLMLDLGGGDSVVLDRHFSQAVQRVEQLELSDGTALVLADGMKGGPADGIVVGTAGSDFLDAGAGDDVLVGGAGNDLLIGRQGADSYIFGAGDGIDRISEGGDSAPTILAAR